MPQSHPDAQTLLAAAVDQLEAEVYPTLQGGMRYRTRIVLNVLRVVQRELALGAGFDAQDAAELQKLPGLESGGAEVLTQRIEDGQADLDDPRLVAFLRQSLDRALAINNPRWTRSDAPAKETP